MGKVGVPPAVVCECLLMQARRLLYPLFCALVRNMSYIIYRRTGVIIHSIRRANIRKKTAKIYFLRTMGY